MHVELSAAGARREINLRDTGILRIQRIKLKVTYVLKIEIDRGD